MKEFLVYFASKNCEFRVPELESLAKCLGLELWVEPRTLEQHKEVRT